MHLELTTAFKSYCGDLVKEYAPKDPSEVSYLASARGLFTDLSEEIKRIGRDYPDVVNLKPALADIAWDHLEMFKSRYRPS